ncbi:ArsR/SmtB family transcription factor [Microbacterium sp. YY-01]|uniref:ArsR/SmtB family transcription factor n=1 Tax=Microbacterium sp. YY-01 TaxID=3421634 RepID=UPI003D16CDAD
MTKKPGSAKEDPAPRTMTTAMLKALANPLRQEIMRVVMREQFARAADIAVALDEPANKVSFHLRVLADAELIAEAPEKARDRRDRVWAAVPASLNVGGPEAPITDEALSSALIRALVDDHNDLVRRVIAYSAEYISGRTTEEHGTFVQSRLRLTPQEFHDMFATIQNIVNDARQEHDPQHPESRLWQIDFVAGDETLP